LIGFDVGKGKFYPFDGVYRPVEFLMRYLVGTVAKWNAMNDRRKCDALDVGQKMKGEGRSE
jgi:hypothetical protein